MRVLHVQDKCGLDGARIQGVQRLLLWWWPAFRSSAAEMSLCILRKRNEAARSFDEAGIPARFLGRGRFDPRAAFELADLVRRERIDVLHCHGYGSTDLERIAGHRTGRPVVIHEHMIDAAVPSVQRAADRALAPWTSRAIAVSGAVAEFLEHGRSVPREKIAVVPNGIPEESFASAPECQQRELRAQLGLPEGRPIVGTVGRLHPVKGHDDFLRAAQKVAARVPGALFAVVGDGALLPELERAARGAGLGSRVRFLGYQADVAPIIGLFDVLVVASRSEGFSLTAAEAMAQGKPVVATRVGGIPEVVRDGETGLLAPASDPAALADAIIALLSDPARARALGQRGLEVCRERFSVAATVRSFCEIYADLLSAPGAA